MLQTKSFPVGSDKEINEFMQTCVPASIAHEGAFTVIVYDDNTPFNEIQKKNSIRVQMAKQIEKIMQSQINVSLTKKSVKEIKDIMGKEVKETIRGQAEQAKRDLEDQESILEELTKLHDSYK